tara:strand:+ start:225 stop:476 length:252 start_codon:yes stop_codon:yes gene_type:complete
MQLISTFDIKPSINLGFELKFADRLFVTDSIKIKESKFKPISRKKIRVNPDLVKLLGKSKVLDLLDFFEAEARDKDCKTGTDS